MHKFELKGEYIELNKLLKIVNLVGSGGEAGMVITEGYIKVNGDVETRKRKKIIKGDKVEFEDQMVVIV